MVPMHLALIVCNRTFTVNLFSSWRMLLRSTTLTARLRPVVKTSAVAVMQKPADFILRTERFVREQIVVLDHDASHDWR